MSTTTIRIDDRLKERVSAAAAQAGMTAHAFILDAIAQTVEQVEADNAFHHTAQARWDGILESGKSVPWEEARAYLLARSRGELPRKPVAKRTGP